MLFFLLIIVVSNHKKRLICHFSLIWSCSSPIYNIKVLFEIKNVKLNVKCYRICEYLK